MDVSLQPIRSSSVYQVDDLTIDVDQVRVSRAGVDIKLPRLSFDLLVALIEVSPAVATTDYLLESVWPGLVVNSETVTQRVKLLRTAFGEDPKLPRYIEVVRGRGYRLLPKVEKVAALAHVTVGQPDADRNRVAAIRRLRVMIGVSTLVLVGVVTLALIRGSVGRPADQTHRQAEPSQIVLPPRTVAVLPFESLEPGAKEDAFLASAFADSVLHALAVTPQITVIARRSSFAYKDRNIDVSDIGRRLNARYLLEGSLHRSNRQVRIRAELIDAATRISMWSVSFDRPIEQMAALQDEIAAKVAHALQVTLNASADERRHPAGSANLDAYLEYLQARELAESYRSPDVDSAIGHYRRAIELDPAFSAAYSGLAWAKYQKLQYRPTETTNADWGAMQREVRPYLQKALTLNNRNADAWQTLAAIDDDPDRSELYDRRAVALEPNLARAQFGLAEAVLRTLDSSPQRSDEVPELLGKAMALDPLEPKYPTELAEFYLFYQSSRLDRAASLAELAVELDPSYFPALLTLAEVHLLVQQQIADAVRAAEEALARDPDSTAVRSLLVNTYLALDDYTAAEQLLSDPRGNKSDWVTFYYHRQEWHKAAEIMYQPQVSANVPSGASYLTGKFSVRMDGNDPQFLHRAMQFLQEDAGVTWNGDLPTISHPLSCSAESAISLADLMRSGGEAQRARRLLESVLTTMDTASIRYKRGEFWYSLQRVRALSLLGRKEEALTALKSVPTGGEAINWREVEYDPAYELIRNDARVHAFLQAQRAHVASENTKIREMRESGVIPDRAPAWAVTQTQNERLTDSAKLTGAPISLP